MKRVLLAVCGLTPQVVTETLYALMRQGRMVQAVHVLTTRPGREACLAHLLAPETGHFHRFVSEYGLDPGNIDFSTRSVTAVADDLGREIEDISLEEENECFLRACMEKAFLLTREEDATVYFSIAGGRKTMGACLALAAQMYARPDDRIFHVLVSPEFESCRDFYFPPAKSIPVTLRDKAGHPYTKETRYATITLVPMPFFPLRSRITDALLKKPESPATLMLSAVRTPHPELTIDLKGRTIGWKGFQLDLPPAHLALYAFFGLLKKQAYCPEKNCHGCDACTISYGELASNQSELTRMYQRITAGGPETILSDSGITSLSKENFKSYRAKINASIEKRFGTQDHRRLLIESFGRRPGVRYGLHMAKARITIIQ
ncbi:CRISPR-associated ring nuclease Csm6 [Desulfolutivibrio sulfoxidireducens]|uniref:CRISPR-associated ring nuclease Csm6 n=1 Tax=Desulfolutivibrio sulfoxidireducens TaxID=2773299 RepID=UPI00159DE727|nr:CRISPR-associated ring nuclease Csm6 [Desulfolutivibrio sulfoxidireducens]